MDVTALMINPGMDNVGTVTVALEKGDIARFVKDGSAQEVVLRDAIPIYHKFCAKAVKKGEPVLKYGEQLGLATQDIAVGEYVHTHNLESQRDS